MRLIRINFFAPCTKWYIRKTGCLLLQPAQTLRNSDSVRRCDGIFKRRVHNSTRAQNALANENSDNELNAK